ncbi:FmdB family zinc ribbon protein [Paraburkholderia sp. GAS334]|jgi:putative FmdB family regulatory protein|uniref:FmdB family zinc ribbon protein n=1 Tax=unclassified Paraburkholderia TaxID=2615204 RepID=UPI003D25901C
MPIYAYRCESCGFGKDVLQKMSDAPLTQCPECGKDAFRKQVTAAGFQLKGSGWYVTDFRGGAGGAAAAAKPAAGEGAVADSGQTDSGKTDAGSSSAGADSAKAAPAAPAAAAPASNSGADGA